MVAGALHVLEMMPFFNAAKHIHNFINQDIHLRISCHQGPASYTTNHEDMHGRTIDYFLKYEREIGQQDSVTITHVVYDELTSADLKRLFVPAGSHEITTPNGPGKTALFRSLGLQRGLLLDKQLVEVHSDEHKLQPFRTTLHHYHVTQLDGTKLWRYRKYDFSSAVIAAGRLTTSIEALDMHGHPHRYDIAAGLIDERFFIFEKNLKSSEPTIIEVYPHMGILALGLYAGVGFMQTWDGSHVVTKCMFSKEALPGITDEGDVPRDGWAALDKLWNDRMTRQGDLVIF